MQLQQLSGHRIKEKPEPSVPKKLTWRPGKPILSATSNDRTVFNRGGVAVAHGDIAYFSCEYKIYAYSLPSDSWRVLLRRCDYRDFGLAVVNGELTVIGGHTGDFSVTNTLLSMVADSSWAIWKEHLPSMPTSRAFPEAVTTSSHLIVAGGMVSEHSQLSTVEVMDMRTLQWSTVSSLPEDFCDHHMSLCGDELYLSYCHRTFSCSVNELLDSAKPASVTSHSLWSALADIPVPYDTHLVTWNGRLLSIGGNPTCRNPQILLHCYDRLTNSWSLVEQVSAPGFCVLATVLGGGVVVLIRRFDSTDFTEIGQS